jgi:hypothetical protein
MSDTPQDPPATQLSHLTNYMDEVMAAIRMKAMDALVQELYALLPRKIINSMNLSKH